MLAIAMVALSSDAQYSLGAIRQELSTRWPDLPPADETEAKEGVLSLNLGGQSLFFARMPAPIPWGDLEGPCATSVLWPDAAEQLGRQREHVVVTVLSEAGPVEAATLLTQATAALCAACGEAIGVYWGNAALVIPRDMFIEFAVEVLPDEPPLPIWLDLRVGPNDHGRTAGFTQGMAALGHMEIEALDSPESPAELRERLYGLAAYLLEHGAVISDGDTVGEDQQERIRVVHTESAFGHEGRVMRLIYEQQPPAKPWWKKW